MVEPIDPIGVRCGLYFDFCCKNLWRFTVLLILWNMFIMSCCALLNMGSSVLQMKVFVRILRELRLCGNGLLLTRRDVVVVCSKVDVLRFVATEECCGYRFVRKAGRCAERS